MLNVKSWIFNPFWADKLKKGENFHQGCKKNRALLDFFGNLVSRFSLILTKICFSIERK